MATTSDFEKMLAGYGLTTANIWYYNPDNQHIINDKTYTWQEYDTCPHFPVLLRFLRAWDQNCEGKVAHVVVAHTQLIKPAELRAIGSEFRLH